jgi:aspartate racemase
MKPKTIGIVGGAGPFAGARLFEQVLILSNRQYGCYRDADYPQVLLISFPFSDMLSSQKDDDLLRKELSGSLNLLRQQGAAVLAIACNTLHNFLDASENFEDLIQLPSVLENEFRSEEIPLVLCTTTSRQYKLHRNFFMCNYPTPAIQAQVDAIIDRILQGAESLSIVKDLMKVIEGVTASTIVLGCTELSLFMKELSVSTKRIVDPLEIMARKLLEKSFTNRSKK